MAKLIFTKEDKKLFRKLQKRAEKKGVGLEWKCDIKEENGYIVVDKHSCRIGNVKGIAPETCCGSNVIGSIHSHPVSPDININDINVDVMNGNDFGCVWHVSGPRINCVGNLQNIYNNKNQIERVDNDARKAWGILLDLTLQKKRKIQRYDKITQRTIKKYKLKEFSFSKR